MTVKSSISLSDEHHAFARTQVHDGRFPSVSAVVQHSLELLRQKTEDEALERTALKMLLGERIEGPFVDAATMRERIAARIAARRESDPDNVAN